jgi:hypothetical protein
VLDPPTRTSNSHSTAVLLLQADPIYDFLEQELAPRTPVSSARFRFTARGVGERIWRRRKIAEARRTALPSIGWYGKAQCKPRRWSVVKHRQRRSAITRLQSKEQRARFLYVSFNAALKGRFKGDGRWMVDPADEGQCVRKPTHCCSIDRRFVHFLLRWAGVHVEDRLVEQLEATYFSISTQNAAIKAGQGCQEAPAR